MSYNIKTVYGDDIRRFTLSVSDDIIESYDDLIDLVSIKYGITNNAIILKYIDEDGDHVTLSESDCDVFFNQYASGSKVGKVIVSKRDSSSSSSNARVSSASSGTQTSITSGNSKSTSASAGANNTTAKQSVDEPTVRIGSATLDVELDSPLHSHILKYIKNAYSGNGYVCDSCNCTGSSVEHSWHCKKCTFDLCNTCAKPQIPVVDSISGSNEQKPNEKQEKKSDLYDDILPLLHAVLSNDKIRLALSPAITIGIDTLVNGGTASEIIGNMVQSNDEIKNDKSVNLLINRYLPRVLPYLQQTVDHVRPFISTSNTQFIDMIKGFLPALLPSIISNIDTQIVNLINDFTGSTTIN